MFISLEVLSVAVHAPNAVPTQAVPPIPTCRSNSSHVQMFRLRFRSIGRVLHPNFLYKHFSKQSGTSLEDLFR